MAQASARGNANLGLLWLRSSQSIRRREHVAIEQVHVAYCYRHSVFYPSHRIFYPAATPPPWITHVTYHDASTFLWKVHQNMCNHGPVSDYISTDTWSIKHSVFPPLAVCIAMLWPRDAPWTFTSVVALHLFFTVVHWQDEWLETHTGFGGEYALKTLFSGNATCESVDNWLRDSPTDAMVGYFSSLAHLALLLYAPQMRTEQLPARTAAVLAASFTFAIARVPGNVAEAYKSGLPAVGLLGSVLTVSTQGLFFIIQREFSARLLARDVPLTDTVTIPPSKPPVVKIHRPVCVL